MTYNDTYVRDCEGISGASRERAPRVVLDSVQRLHAKKTETCPHGDSRCFTKQQSAALFIRPQHPTVGNEVCELRSQDVKVIAKAVRTQIRDARLQEGERKG